jgi:hypothetical protein
MALKSCFSSTTRERLLYDVDRYTHARLENDYYTTCTDTDIDRYRHTHTHTCTHTSTNTHTNTHTYTHKHTHIHTHNPHTHTHIHTTHTHTTHTANLSKPSQTSAVRQAARSCKLYSCRPKVVGGKGSRGRLFLARNRSPHVVFTTMSGLYKETGAVGCNKVKWLSTAATPEI